MLTSSTRRDLLKALRTFDRLRHFSPTQEKKKEKKGNKKKKGKGCGRQKLHGRSCFIRRFLHLELVITNLSCCGTTTREGNEEEREGVRESARGDREGI